MKLVPVNLSEVTSNLTYSRGRNQKLVEEFIASGYETAEVTDYTQAQSTSCSNALACAIKSLNVPQVKVRIVNKRVYLYRTDITTSKED